MKRIAIIHFSPIELYPPAINDIEYLSKHLENVSITVYTTADKGTLFLFDPRHSNTKIKRIGMVYRNKWMRYLNYFFFHLGATLHLIFNKPSVVFYFETLSAFPALLYKKYINKKAALMVHYHEYTPLYEYQNGMTLNRWFHDLEKKCYRHFEWISHMLEKRMELFLADHADLKIKNTFVIGNYPPDNWKQANNNKVTYPVKIIYIGALSMSSMYLKEFAAWVEAYKGKMVVDIYTLNYEGEAYDYLKSLNSSFINFKNGIRYFEIPDILKNYHVGVILYKGIIPNHVYSAPNKLFEYLSADLDVWMPDTILGALQYETSGTFPKVEALDFTRLSEINLCELLDRTGLAYKPSEYYANSELKKLKDKFQSILSGSSA